MILEISSKIQTFKDKVTKDFPTFVNSVDSLQVKELESNLERYAKYLEEILFELKYNEKIKEAAELVSVLSKPYTTKISFYKGKTRELNKFIDDGIANQKSLMSALVEYSKLTEREKFKRDQDPKLDVAKTELNDLKSGFNDGKKAVEAKIKYINILILEKEPIEELEELKING